MSEDDENVVSITLEAENEIKKLMAAHPGCVGIRLGVSSKGCSGKSYTFEPISELGPFDEVVDANGAVVAVEPLNQIALWGTQIGWGEDMFSSGFTFTNPNETGRCGCGESFTTG
ncbi:HesB/IscA family protein [Thalassospira xianhensis]|uniref:Iron-sulfur cluster assembly protein n=2 Tax=Thalassospira TaxID=168934 RepID=A0A285TWR4_9PROT|nr:MULTISPECIES: iron-sulfur cluster assembly accessory protein [Thalassospira]RCK07773.1 hypothetical protein TH5_01645 [Thalassospira xianhensis MCCC 1A02616]SOC26863.1 iron-sulfur cluster assembly protein [Thalassospira xiamenensis]